MSRLPHACTLTRLPLRRRRDRVVQRGADAAALDAASQLVLSAELDIRPIPSQHRYLDYWGTRVSTVRDAHTAPRALADRDEPRRGAPERRAAGRTLGWDDLRRRRTRRRPRSSTSTLGRRPTTPPPRSSRSPRARAEARSRVGEAALAICLAIGAAIEYMPGVTSVHTTAAEAWERAQGRVPGHRAPRARRAAVGRHPRPLRVRVPAPRAGRRDRRDRQRASRTRGSSGSAGTWRGYDPTNLIEIGDRHVLVGRGRDYSDVPPLRGVYAGPDGSRALRDGGDHPRRLSGAAEPAESAKGMRRADDRAG